MFTVVCVLVVILLGIIAHLLSQILTTQREQLAAAEQYREIQRFEALAMAYFPTLWLDPDLRDEIVRWLPASRSGEQKHRSEWNWHTLADQARAIAAQPLDEAPRSKIDALIAASETFRAKGQERNLTYMETDFLIFRAWRCLRLGDDALPRDHQLAAAFASITESERRLFRSSSSNLSSSVVSPRATEPPVPLTAGALGSLADASDRMTPPADRSSTDLLHDLLTVFHPVFSPDEIRQAKGWVGEADVAWWNATDPVDRADFARIRSLREALFHKKLELNAKVFNGRISIETAQEQWSEFDQDANRKYSPREADA